MLKLEIKLDEQKVQAEGKYSPAAIYDALDRTFSKYRFRREVLARDYGTFGRLITSLKDKDWFVPYLVKWLWYNSDDGENEEDFTVEDVLYHYTHRESAA